MSHSEAFRREPEGGRFGACADDGAPDFVVVLSQERTGTTALSHSLKQAFGDECVIQVHYLNADKYRGPARNQDKLDSIADKRAREARVREWLSNPSLRGVVFTVVREPVSRIASAVWIDRTEQLLAHYDRAGRTFRPQVASVIERKLGEALMKQVNYAEDVYAHLDLPNHPAPGAYRTPSGARLFVLDFERLADDFAVATEAAFGEPVPLLAPWNSADRYGDLEAYADFRRFCRELLRQREVDKAS